MTLTKNPTLLDQLGNLMLMVQTVCLRNRVILDRLGNKEYLLGHEAHDRHTVCRW